MQAKTILAEVVVILALFLHGLENQPSCKKKVIWHFFFKSQTMCNQKIKKHNKNKQLALQKDYQEFQSCLTLAQLENFETWHLKLHKIMRRVESSLATQIRSKTLVLLIFYTENVKVLCLTKVEVQRLALELVDQS